MKFFSPFAFRDMFPLNPFGHQKKMTEKPLDGPKRNGALDELKDKSGKMDIYNEGFLGVRGKKEMENSKFPEFK